MGRLIDADKLIKAMNIKCKVKDDRDAINVARAFNKILDIIRDAPTIDAVEVVRCCDCEHMYDGLKDDGYLICHKFNYFINADDFCSYGERKTDHE